MQRNPIRRLSVVKTTRLYTAADFVRDLFHSLKWPGILDIHAVIYDDREAYNALLTASLQHAGKGKIDDSSSSIFHVHALGRYILLCIFATVSLNFDIFQQTAESENPSKEIPDF